jgi:hypothetical protein
MLATSQQGYDYTTDVKTNIILGENRTQCVLSTKSLDKVLHIMPQAPQF